MATGREVHVADTGNNRVLIWSTTPVTNGSGANIVLGQGAMNGSGSGTTATNLRSPHSVYSDGSRIFVGDYNNDRVLIWNSIPASDGVAADVVVGQNTMTTSGSGSASATNMYYPEVVSGDGTRL